MKKAFLISSAAVMVLSATAAHQAMNMQHRLAQNIAFADSHSGNSTSAITKAKAAGNISFSSDYISEQPAGVYSAYTRSGSAFLNMYGSLYLAEQDGMLLEMVTAEDGETVYLKNPVSNLTMDTWVQGRIEGNKIHLPLYQTLYYYEDSYYGYGLAKLDISYTSSGTTWEADLDATEMTYTLHEDGTFSIDGTEADESGYGASLLGVIYTDDFTWVGYGDWESVYTPFDEKMAEVPASVVLEDYVLKSDIDNIRIQAGTDGEHFYLCGIVPGPIVGDIDGDKVTFMSDQFVGDVSGYCGYFVAAGVELVYDEIWDEYYTAYVALPSLTFDYDAANKSLVCADEERAFVINTMKSEEGISYVQSYDNPSVVIYREIAGKPATPVFLAVDEDVDYGQWALVFTTPNLTVDGDYIDPAKIEWAILTDGEINVFTPDDGYYLDENMEWFPYGFEDYAGWDIFPQGSVQYVYMYIDLYNEIGLQSRVTFDDVTYYSDIINYDLETGETYITEVENPDIPVVSLQNIKAVKAANLFDLQGRRMNQNSKGLIISNGKISFVK